MTDTIEPVTIKTEPVKVEIELTLIKKEYINSDDDDDSAAVKNGLETQNIKGKDEITPTNHVDAGSSNNNNISIAANAKKRILRTRKKTYVSQDDVLSDKDGVNIEQEKPRFTSLRGNSMMVLNKYTYSVETKRKITGETTEILWFCFNGRPTHCQAKAYTVNGDIVRVSGTHNHYHKRKYLKKSSKKSNNSNTSINSGKDPVASPKNHCNSQSPENAVDVTTVNKVIKTEPDPNDMDVATSLKIKSEAIEIEVNPFSYDTTEPDKSTFGIPVSNHKTDPFLPQDPSLAFTMGNNVPFQEHLLSVPTDKDKTSDELDFNIAMHDCPGKKCTKSLDSSNAKKTNIFPNCKNTKQMFFCDDCKGCFGRQKLIRHRCKKLYPCNICNRKLINKFSSIVHVTTHRNEYRGLFHCKACGATFAMERHLKTHVTRVHNRK